MGDLKTVPKREWATSTEVVTLLKRLLESAEKGEIVAFAYVADRKTDEFESGATKVNNCFAMGGYLFSMGMRLIGFDDNRNRRIVDKS